MSLTDTAYHEGFRQGVLKATADPTFDEANLSGFDEPYSLVIRPGPIKNWLKIRREKLIGREKP